MRLFFISLSDFGLRVPTSAPRKSALQVRQAKTFDKVDKVPFPTFFFIIFAA